MKLELTREEVVGGNWPCKTDKSVALGESLCHAWLALEAEVRSSHESFDALQRRANVMARDYDAKIGELEAAIVNLKALVDSQVHALDREVDRSERAEAEVRRMNAKLDWTHSIPFGYAPD